MAVFGSLDDLEGQAGRARAGSMTSAASSCRALLPWQAGDQERTMSAQEDRDCPLAQAPLRSNATVSLP